MLIIGTRFFTCGSEMTAQPWRCNKCGHAGPFIIPVIPISGVKHIAECPNCGTRYQAMAAAA